MNKILFSFLLLFYIADAHAVSVLPNRIIETSNIERLYEEVDEDTIVFFDIDDTLLCRSSMFSSTPWWKYCTEYLNEATRKEKKKKAILSIIHYAALKTTCCPVDPRTSDIIKDFQERGILVFGLTARFMNSSKPNVKSFDLVTNEELEAIGIQFSKYEKADLMPCFRYGILFTSSCLKGPILGAFLKLLGKEFKKVVFIDDNWGQINSVQSLLIDRHIPSVCYRYSKVERENKKFDPLIGNIQLRELVENKVILSNEEAKAIAEQTSLDPNFYLDELLAK